MNVARVLQQTAAEWGSVPALIDVRKGRDRVLDFRDMETSSARLAAQIEASGISRGDGVLILHPMAIELYVFLIALFRIGAVGVFLDPSAGRAHVERCCELYPLRAFFGSAKAQLLRLSTPALRRIPLAFCPGWFPGTRRVEHSADGPKQSEIVVVQGSDPALITFTSGSTGQPKAASRSHAFLLAQHRALATSIGLVAGVTDLTTLPIFVLANLASGVTSVLPDADMRIPGKIEALPVLAQIARHHVKTIGASPALIGRLVAACSRTGRSVPEVEHVFMGGAPVFPSDLRQARNVFPRAEITAVYGSTEAEPMAEVPFSAIADDDFLAMERGCGLLAGAPVSSLTLHVIVEQWGIPIPPLNQAEFDRMCLPAEQVGEIVVSGEHVLAGYLNGAGDSETKFDAGGARWHRTGDLGRLDRDGRLWLLGRAAAKIQDARGILYPFAIECAAQQTAGVGRAAVMQVEGRRILAIESNRAGAHSDLLRNLAWAQLDEIRTLRCIPMDKRHNAKVDYVALADILASSPGFPVTRI
jgi:acyl-CoA synthetase (AMP-forming)/AMP-acid ligase II